MGMRVLMTADTIGGVWTYAVELVSALRARDVEVALATLGAPLTEDRRKQIGRLPHVELFESSYKLEWMADPWDDVRRSGDWLLNVAARVPPDVVHLNSFGHGALPWNAPVLVVGHSCVSSWWSAVKREELPREWDRYRDVVGECLRRADAVAAPSQWMLSELRRLYPAFRNGVCIANALDPHGFQAMSAKLPLVFAAGRVWDEAKNIAALDRVASRLPWPVHTAGQGGSLGPLDAREMAHWYADAAIYALPAKYEPFGLSVLEAALSGCALVLGDIASLRENWDAAAEFADPFDDVAIEAAIRRVIADPNLLRSRGRAARARALEFTPRRMCDEYMDLYSALVRSRMPLSCAS